MKGECHENKSCFKGANCGLKSQFNFTFENLSENNALHLIYLKKLSLGSHLVGVSKAKALKHYFFSPLKSDLGFPASLLLIKSNIFDVRKNKTV